MGLILFLPLCSSGRMIRVEAFTDHIFFSQQTWPSSLKRQWARGQGQQSNLHVHHGGGRQECGTQPAADSLRWSDSPYFSDWL